MRALRFSLVRLAASLLLVVPASRATAQFTSGLVLGARSQRVTGDHWRGAFALAPDLRFDARWLALSAHGTLLRGSALSDAAGERGRMLSWNGALRADLFSPTWHGLRASASLRAERTTSPTANDPRYADRGDYDRLALLADLPVSHASMATGTAEVRLSYRRGTWGGWLGKDAAVDNRATPLPVTADGSLGIWRQVGGAVLALSLANTSARTGARAASVLGPGRRDSVFNDTTRTWNVFERPAPIDSGSPGTLRAFTDAQGTLHWMRGRLAFDATLGARLRTRAVPAERWGQVDGTFAIAPRAAIVIGGGVRPSVLAYATPSTRYAHAGLRLSASAFFRSSLTPAVRPLPAAFGHRDAGGGRQTLHVRVPNARIVEIAGSFTLWKPLSMRHVEGDLWTVTLPIAQGTHQVAIRIDGDAWLAPPGTTTVADDFNGTVGLLVVN